MSSERFPVKKIGDSLSVRHINRLGKTVERLDRQHGGTNISSHHGNSILGMSGREPFRQFVLEVTNLKINDDDSEESGFFLGRIRWYSAQDEEWKTDDSEVQYEIDASDANSKLRVGDRVTAFWDIQRGMFIPVNRVRPLIDLDSGSGVVPSDDTGGQDIDFALEIQSGLTVGSWGRIHGRFYTVNGNFGQSPEQEIRASGTAFYTFRAKDGDLIRFRTMTNIKDVVVILEEANLRLEAKDDEGINYSFGTPWVTALTATSWTSVAEANIDDEDTAALPWPTFVPQSDGTILIRTPLNNEGIDNQIWTVKAEVSAHFLLEPLSSSSASSTTSESSTTETSASSPSSMSTHTSLSSSSPSSGGSTSSPTMSDSSSSSSSSSITSSASSSCMVSFPALINQITGYDNTKMQVLTHNRGCLQWVDVAECP